MTTLLLLGVVFLAAALLGVGAAAAIVALVYLQWAGSAS